MCSHVTTALQERDKLRVEFMADAKIGAAGSVAGFAAKYRGSLRLRVALDHAD